MSRVAIITGASRGIGAATARVLAERGFRVVVNYHSSAEEAEEVVASITAAGGEAVATSLGHALEPRLLDDPLIVSIARRVGKTAAQVLLAWGIQRGSAVLTGSVTPSRISENFNVTALPDNAIEEISERLTTRIRFNSVADGGEPGFAEVPQGS